MIFSHRIPYFVVWFMIGGTCSILRFGSLSSWIKYLALEADRMAIAAPLCSVVVVNMEFIESLVWYRLVPDHRPMFLQCFKARQSERLLLRGVSACRVISNVPCGGFSYSFTKFDQVRVQCFDVYYLIIRPFINLCTDTCTGAGRSTWVHARDLVMRDSRLAYIHKSS